MPGSVTLNATELYNASRIYAADVHIKQFSILIFFTNNLSKVNRKNESELPIFFSDD
jgi:hypothetical protein